MDSRLLVVHVHVRVKPERVDMMVEPRTSRRYAPVFPDAAGW